MENLPLVSFRVEEKACCESHYTNICVLQGIFQMLGCNLPIHNAKHELILPMPVLIFFLIITMISLESLNYGHAQSSNINSDSSSKPNRFVILNFDDSHRSQIDYAKPILDKYGFKATFFHVCGWIGNDDWQQIAKLKQEGMDIQAHTVEHPDLNKVSEEALEREVAGSKQCFHDRGFNTTIFAYPFGVGSHNSTIVDQVAQSYDLARASEREPLAFLHCDVIDQVDCRTYDENGKLNRENRYSINSWSHNHIDGPWSYDTQSCMDNTCRYYNNDQMFDRFVNAVNSQDEYNIDGTVRAIPIIVYHTFAHFSDVSDSKVPVDTSVNLFEREMKYLHDNGFQVLTMADLGYDESKNQLYIKNMTRPVLQ
jgi:peptidoglycan/xylan/chitin deacetylase (PgdA/CDA1 family)